MHVLSHDWNTSEHLYINATTPSSGHIRTIAAKIEYTLLQRYLYFNRNTHDSANSQNKKYQQIL